TFPIQPALCGMGVERVPLGTRRVIVEGDGRSTLGGLGCDVEFTEEMLRAYAGEFPALTGTGPPGFVVAGWLGPANLTVLDREGRPLRFVHGEVDPEAVAVCDDGRTAAVIGSALTDNASPSPPVGGALEL